MRVISSSAIMGTKVISLVNSGKYKGVSDLITLLNLIHVHIPEVWVDFGTAYALLRGGTQILYTSDPDCRSGLHIHKQYLFLSFANDNCWIEANSLLHVFDLFTETERTVSHTQGLEWFLRRRHMPATS